MRRKKPLVICWAPLGLFSDGLLVSACGITSVVMTLLDQTLACELLKVSENIQIPIKFLH